MTSAVTLDAAPQRTFELVVAVPDTPCISLLSADVFAVVCSFLSLHGVLSLHSLCRNIRSLCQHPSAIHAHSLTLSRLTLADVQPFSALHLYHISQSFTHIRSLSIGYPINKKLTDTTCAIITQCTPALTHLDLTDCHQVTEAILCLLPATHPALVSLSLRQTFIVNNQSLFAIRLLNNITNLDLSMTDMTDQSMKHLQIIHLRRLCLNGNANITDNGVSQLFIIMSGQPQSVSTASSTSSSHVVKRQPFVTEHGIAHGDADDDNDDDDALNIPQAYHLPSLATQSTDSSPDTSPRLRPLSLWRPAAAKSTSSTHSNKRGNDRDSIMRSPSATMHMSPLSKTLESLSLLHCIQLTHYWLDTVTRVMSHSYHHRHALCQCTSNTFSTRSLDSLLDYAQSERNVTITQRIYESDSSQSNKRDDNRSHVYHHASQCSYDSPLHTLLLSSPLLTHLESFHQYKHLSELSLGSPLLTDISLDALTYCPLLSVLTISQSAHVKTFAWINDCASLISLRLYQLSCVNDHSIEIISLHSNITLLALSHLTAITAASFSYISRMTQLSVLSLAHCPFVDGISLRQSIKQSLTCRRIAIRHCPLINKTDMSEADIIDYRQTRWPLSVTRPDCIVVME